MKHPRPTLYIFSGLPATGKSTLARMLAGHLKAAWLRIDTIEQALRDLCNFQVQGEGYRLSYRVARDNLTAGNDVIADSCNPIQLTRDEWNGIAIEAGASYVNIEVVCSDKDEHRHRTESRVSEVDNLRLPTWEQVVNREYHPGGDADRIVIDTANRAAEESFQELLAALGQNNSRVTIRFHEAFMAEE